MSRAGSQVMTRGRRGGRGDRVGVGGGEEVDDDDDDGEGAERAEGEVIDREEGETRSIISAILSSSSGQMSGQCEKPK